MSPIQPTDTFRRVVRGGTWNYTSASIVRAAYGFVNTPSNCHFSLGFRCAQRGRQPLKVSLD